jgi:sulfatase maturation enzyme AslB (radical SAM superfamily)
MTFETAKQVIDDLLSGSEKIKQYIDSYDTAGIIIEFIGGEPLMAIDLISQISDYFVE